jgi:hypothetical protein
MNLVLTVLQLAGALAVLAGVAVLLPLGAALVADGLLVLVVSTLFEALASARRSAPSDGRSRPQKPGVE